MAEEPKKISFGFSKISKKPAINLPQKKEEKDFQLIDSLEGNSIKLVNGEEKEKGDLVIPLNNANILRDNMIEALKARREERLSKKVNNVDEEKTNGSGIKSDEKPLTLDELAAKEILEDLKQNREKEETPTVTEIPKSNITSLGEKESTLDDYLNVPIQEFGLAVLRGMGWTPDKGVGKTGQVVVPINPVVRPKGMGLGADKVMRTQPTSKGSEDLVMKKNAFLKIITGPYKNLYGKVEGFDELPGRLMVRLTLQNSVISISENLVQLVPSGEYNKNSKILNLTDYQEYHEKNDISNQEKGKKYNIKVEVSESEKRHKTGRGSPSHKGYIQETNRQIKKERNRSYSSDSSADEKYVKQQTQRRRSFSPSSDREQRYNRQRKSRKNNSTSSDSDEKHMKNKKDRPTYSSKSDERYNKSRKEKIINISSSDSEEKYKKTIKDNSKKKSHKSEFEESSRKRKNKRRTSSDDSESEEQYRKARNNKNKNESSGSEVEYRKRKVKKTRSSSSSEEEEDYSKTSHRRKNKKKTRKKKSEVSDSDSELENKYRKEEKKIKKSKQDKYDSDSSPERHTNYKKKHSHSRHKDRSRSRSPSSKKKKKKHRRSRS